MDELGHDGFLERQNVSRQWYHSIPFTYIYPEKTLPPKLISELKVEAGQDRASLGEAMLCFSGKPVEEFIDGVNIVDYPDVKALFQLAYLGCFGDIETRTLKEFDIGSLPYPENHTASLVSDPLVEWLAFQPNRSVSHIELFKKAVEIYKDPLVALGVIGLVFDQERKIVSNRKTDAILGAKMRPLIVNDLIDPIGYNYHFWAYLNIAILNQGEIFFESAFTYLFQKVKQNDEGDYQANMAGLSVGEAIIDKLEKY